MAGFCELATGLRAPILGILGAKLPIVSGGQLKNSRFWEIAAGDRVQSALRARACSATRHSPLWHLANWVCQAGTVAPEGTGI